MNKYFLVLLFSILFFFYYLDILYANNFHQSGNYADNEVFVTTLFSVEKLPLVENDIYTLEYDINSIVGESMEYLYNNLSPQEHFIFLDDMYRRLVGVNDRVSVPPGSKVGILALIKNGTNSNINLRNWTVFISRHNPSLGNLKIFGVEGIYGSKFCKFFGVNLKRSGFFLTSSENISMYPGEVDLVKLEVIDIEQSLEIEAFFRDVRILENGDLVIEHSLKLKNKGKFRMDNVTFLHEDFYHLRDFEPNEEYLYEYEINYGHDYNFGWNNFDAFEIYWDDSKTECVVQGSDFLGAINPNSKMLFYERSGVGLWQDWFGITTDIGRYPRFESMCVTLLNYGFKGKPFNYYVKKDIDLKFVSEENILGIGEELVLKLNVENKGVNLNSVFLRLYFDKRYQKLKDSSCNFIEFEEGLFLELKTFLSGDSLDCNLIFDILEEDHFLVLKNILKIDDEVYKSEIFKFIPDFEFSFVYDHNLNGFFFVSNIKESFAEVQENREGFFLCREIYFRSIKDKICI